MTCCRVECRTRDRIAVGARAKGMDTAGVLIGVRVDTLPFGLVSGLEKVAHTLGLGLGKEVGGR